MAKNPETIKYPRTVLSFYVKLYCKKCITNHSNHRKIFEATKSWTSLSYEDREHFAIKFQEFHNKYKKSLASYLKRAVPVNRTNQKHANRKICNEEELVPRISYDDKEYSSISSRTTFEEPVFENEIDTSQSVTEQVSDSPGERNVGSLQMLDNVQNEDPNTDMPRYLPEPVPPVVKNAKELYEMTKAVDSRSNVSWELLTVTQKSRYREVTLALKKDYIKRYRAYLEYLSPHDLYHHYNKIFN